MFSDALGLLWSISALVTVFPETIGSKNIYADIWIASFNMYPVEMAPLEYTWKYHGH